MDRSKKMLDGKISRRKFLGMTGAGITGALAGCNSSNETESNKNASQEGSEEGSDTPDKKPEGEDSNEPGNYPEQQNEGLMAELDDLADSQDGVYAFRVDDMDYLQIEEFPNIADEFPNQSNFQELAESPTSIEGYDKALYVAANMEPSWMQSNDIYFYVTNPELIEGPVINMFKDSENNPGELSDGEGLAVGYPPEGGIGVQPDQGKEYQADFFRDHIDPDGIVHAVDLDEHDYAVEALHSGFGSE